MMISARLHRARTVAGSLGNMEMSSEDFSTSRFVAMLLRLGQGMIVTSWFVERRLR
ncbi:MAG: hypothetical protein ACJAQT_000312 [Akkermansiaceae bacterium]|jgi:hypothetical protein